MRTKKNKKRDPPGSFREWASDVLLLGGMAVVTAGVWILWGVGAGLLACGACMIATACLIGGVS